jgi:hypothetical protein
MEPLALAMSSVAESRHRVKAVEDVSTRQQVV